MTGRLLDAGVGGGFIGINLRLNAARTFVRDRILFFSVPMCVEAVAAPRLPIYFCPIDLDNETKMPDHRHGKSRLQEQACHLSESPRCSRAWAGSVWA